MSRWPLVALAIFAALFLWERGNRIEAESDAAMAKGRATALTEANRTLSRTIDMVSRQRVDNDAIAAAVAAELDKNATRETVTRTIIEKAVQNDPVANEWASSPVPDSVRQGLRAGQVDPGTR